jgi:hypothetical protein
MFTFNVGAGLDSDGDGNDVAWMFKAFNDFGHDSSLLLRTITAAPRFSYSALRFAVRAAGSTTPSPFFISHATNVVRASWSAFTRQSSSSRNSGSLALFAFGVSSARATVQHTSTNRG